MQESSEAVPKLLQAHPVRLSRAQKDAFLEETKTLLKSMGYQTAISEEPFLAKNRNLIAGSPEEAALVFTAHFDTPYRMLVGSNTIFPRNLLLTVLVQLPLVLAVVGAQILTLIGMAVLGAPLWAAQLAGLGALVLAFWLLAFCVPNHGNRNDNTSGVMTVLEIAAALPAAQRPKAAFVLFDNEEKGMLGSMGFRKKRRQFMRDKTILNFDCVGEGDSILLLQSEAAQKDVALLAALEGARPASGKRLQSCSAKGYLYPSDHMLFEKHIAAAAFQEKKPFGLYISKLHTRRDMVLEQENILLLRQWMCGLVEAYHG